MSLLGAAAASIAATTTTTTTTILDYTRLWPSSDQPLSTSPPWNAITYQQTPTYDGSGVATHPSVVDFYNNPWNGWRFWMAMTPYPNTNDDYENPSILVSNDGATWQVPVGLTNPIYDWQGGESYNSDTELVYDPETNHLICYWRYVQSETTFCRTYAKWSNDGISWSSLVTILDNQGLTDCLSPSVVRKDNNDWWLFGITRKISGQFGVNVYRSNNPLTGWGSPSRYSLAGLSDPWHADVIFDGSAFRMLLVDAFSPFNMRALTSVDGSTWVTSDVVMTRRAGLWDDKLYRPTILVRDDSWMRVWYGAVNNHNWRIGETNMPRSLWNPS